MTLNRANYVQTAVVTGATGSATRDTVAQNTLLTTRTVKDSVGFDGGVGGQRTEQYWQRDSSDATTLIAGGAAFVVNAKTGVCTQDESAQLGGTGAGNVIGVFSASTLAAGEYGWVVVEGYTITRILDATTPAIGDTLTPSTTDGQSAATADFGTITEKPFGTVMSLKNAGSIGANTVEANINPSVRFGR